MVQLTDTVSVIEALGGTDSVAKLTGRKYSAAFNWRSFDTFPPDTFVIMQGALRDAGHDAPVSLWRMVEAAQ